MVQFKETHYWMMKLEKQKADEKGNLLFANTPITENTEVPEGATIVSQVTSIGEPFRISS